MPHSICKHTIGTNVTSRVYTELMEKRNFFKRELNLLKAKHSLEPDNHELKHKAKVNYLLQWALQITANYFYGLLTFWEYNTHIPRCGESVTMI